SLNVPLCLRCKGIDQRVFLASLLTFGVGFIGCGIACFALLFIWDGKTGILRDLGVDNLQGQPNAWFVLVGGVSFIVGLIGGFLIEAVAKLLLIPFFGRA